MPITEGIALWHERDISHSSVERIALPDLCAITEHISEGDCQDGEQLANK
jgi:adenylosuccinate lyase